MIRVLIVDDHVMLAESLVRLLSDDPDIEVVGHEVTAEAGLRRAGEIRPDIVIMDYHLPDLDGATATQLLVRLYPDVKVITLTGSDKRGAYFATRKAGSSAWVRKTRALQELRAAVHGVAAGDAMLDDELDELPTMDQLVVHYQPIVDLRTEVVHGFEGLVRWAHPSGRLVPPDEFLPRAEETGLLSHIDTWVRRQAAHQLALWQAGLPPERRLWVSVNLSASDLADDAIADDIATDVQAAGVDPADFVLEVTETVLLDNEVKILDQLTSIKARGVGLALDDFGTGFSSVSYLRQFPFDVIKIDSTFTSELPESRRTALLVESVHHMASTIGLRAIAEGIEREEQAEVLRTAGWLFGQGYLYSRPVDASACDILLDKEKIR